MSRTINLLTHCTNEKDKTNSFVSRLGYEIDSGYTYYVQKGVGSGDRGGVMKEECIYSLPSFIIKNRSYESIGHWISIALLVFSNIGKRREMAHLLRLLVLDS